MENLLLHNKPDLAWPVLWMSALQRRAQWVLASAIGLFPAGLCWKQALAKSCSFPGDEQLPHIP